MPTINISFWIGRGFSRSIKIVIVITSLEVYFLEADNDVIRVTNIFNLSSEVLKLIRNLSCLIAKEFMTVGAL